MNFEGFDFDNQTKSLLDELDRGKRLPHALIIESPDAQKAEELAVFLSMYAVCGAQEKPCGECKGCQNAHNKNHCDITYLKLQPKKMVYTVEQMRELIRDAYILPNEAPSKVYIFPNCDELFPPQPQNTFLKLSEEPPDGVYFILLCQNAQRLLTTILSRFTVIRLKGSMALDAQAVAAAQEIALAIVESREYPLLKACLALKNKETSQDIITALRQNLRDALAVLSGGSAMGSQDAARQLAARLTRKKLIEMLELCSDCENKLKQNVNINLLTTWLCGEFRRITWQR